MSDSQDHFHEVLSNIAFMISHRLRKPVGTMLGLINLLEAELVSKEELGQVLKELKVCLDELDQSTRLLGEQVHSEQAKVKR